MSSYRDPIYDPNKDSVSRQPVRPFNWVQWIGVACVAFGLATIAIFVAGRLGWIPEIVHNLTPVSGFSVIGIVLINSRQGPAADIAPELAPARRRWMIIVTVVCVVVLGAATVLTLLGL